MWSSSNAMFPLRFRMVTLDSPAASVTPRNPSTAWAVEPGFESNTPEVAPLANMTKESSELLLLSNTQMPNPATGFEKVKVTSPLTGFPGPPVRLSNAPPDTVPN